MHKLEADKEGPIDRMFLQITEWITPFFHKTGHTPNLITTYSLVMGLGAAYYLWKGSIGIFAALFLGSYLFDCVDGYMARRYHQVTVFGDYYDHASDILKFLVTLYVFTQKYSWDLLLPVLISIGVLLAISCVYLGCSQKYSRTAGGKAESIDIFMSFCRAEDTIHWVKYCSNGTVMVAVVLGAVYLEWMH
jgi:phosphatidylglycerophosphate synthase